jgi:hypothetical protein
MRRRANSRQTGEVVGGTPPTASSALVSVTLIAVCKIDGVRHYPGEVFEVTPERATLWREKGLIADPDHPPASEFAWLSQP